MVANLILLLYALITSLGLVFLKVGTKESAPLSLIDGKIHFNFGLYVILGVFLYALSFIIYTYLISKNDLGYIIPLATALVYVFIFIASFLIFKEVFTVVKVLAIALIIAGIILLNLSSKN